MIWLSSHQVHLFWGLLLGLTASLETISGQTIGELLANRLSNQWA